MASYGYLLNLVHLDPQGHGVGQGHRELEGSIGDTLKCLGVTIEERTDEMSIFLSGLSTIFTDTRLREGWFLNLKGTVCSPVCTTDDRCLFPYSPASLRSSNSLLINALN